MIPSTLQVHQARESAGVSRADLAIAAGVGLAETIYPETTMHMRQFTRRNSAAIRRVLETVGAVAVRKDGDAGQRLPEAADRC